MIKTAMWSTFSRLALPASSATTPPMVPRPPKRGTHAGSESPAGLPERPRAGPRSCHPHPQRRVHPLRIRLDQMSFAEMTSINAVYVNSPHGRCYPAGNGLKRHAGRERPMRWTRSSPKCRPPGQTSPSPARWSACGLPWPSPGRWRRTRQSSQVHHPGSHAVSAEGKPRALRPIASEHDLIMTWPDASRTAARCQQDAWVGMACPVSDLSQAAPRSPASVT